MEYIKAPNWGEKWAEAELKKMQKSRIRWERYDGLFIDLIKLLTCAFCIQMVIRWFQ